MSHLKGITKIQLFNGETGELEQEVKEENMVTNAIEECLNLPDYIAAGLDLNENRARSLVYARNPVLDNFFNGILLFEQPMEEKKTRVIAPFDNMEIGHAGDTTSVALSHQGTYNTVESGEIENGYRRVWDFATDRANGKISCVCMTSRAGGTLGEYRQQTYQLGGTTFTSSTRDNTSCSNESGYYLLKEDYIRNPFNDTIKFFYMEQLDNNNIKILGVKSRADIVEIILASPFSQKLKSYSHEVISFKTVYTYGKQEWQLYDWYKDGNLKADPGAEYCYQQASIIGTKETQNIYWGFCPYVYQNKIHIVVPITGGLRHIILNIDTYEIEQNKIIETEVQGYYYRINTREDYNKRYQATIEKEDGSSYTTWVYPREISYNESTLSVAANGGFFFDNHYFYRDATSNTIIVTDTAGKLVQKVSSTALFSNVYIDEINHCVLIGEGFTGYRVALLLLKKDTEGKYYSSYHEVPRGNYAGYTMYDKYSSWMSAPMKIKEKALPFYCYGGWGNSTSTNSSHAFGLHYGYLYTFLSTINNLSPPVTKTNGQTMKITYDIIQEDD